MIWVIVHFYQVPTQGLFRWGHYFWNRTGQNEAICLGTKETLRFDTVARVGMYEAQIPKGVEPLSCVKINEFIEISSHE